MNGVRRLLGATASPSASPPTNSDTPLSPQTIPFAFAQKSGPSWPPSSPGSSQQTFVGSPESPRGTAGLSLKKDRLRAPPLPTQPATVTVQYGANDTVAGSQYVSRQSTGTSSALKSSRQYSDYGSASLSRSQTMPSAPASAGPSSPNIPPPPARKSGSNDPSWVQTSGPLNTRDELLISLMASEAVIDSRDFEILSAEEVEELKKEHQVLTSRLGAMTKKLALETKIRDAALSLSKVNAAHKQVSRQTSEQVDAANLRVEKAQKEVWKLSDRVNEVHRRLMEHRAGVLSFSVRNMEKKAESISADSGYDSSNRSTMLTSPALSSSAAGLMSPPSARFDGAHLFAGHADTVVPRRRLNAESALAEISALEERLARAREELNEAGQRQADMTRELSMVRLEKQEVETVMGMDLQAAEETIAALENEIPRLEEIQKELRELKEEKRAWDEKVKQVELEKEIWEEEMLRLREEKEELEAEVERGVASGAGEAQHARALEELRASSERMLLEKDAEIEELHTRMDEAQEAWERERQVVEDEKMEDLARLQEEMDEERARDEVLMQKTQEELKAGLGALEGLMRRHNILVSGRDTSLQVMLVAVGRHLETVQGKMDGHAKAQVDWEATRRRMEEEHRGGVDRLSKELIETQREKDLVAQELEAMRREAVSMQNAPKSKSPDPRRTPTSSTRELPTPPEKSTNFGDSSSGDAAHVISVLQPLWSILPSPEARAAKFSSSNRTFRTGSPVANSPGGAGGHGHSGSIATSISDLDVRSLKSLYQASAAAANSSNGNSATTPTSPKPPPSPSFTVEAFAARVQALVADDKALIERLVRFAQAHDLLKKNAERAQKLAQDGNHALETYQKQVRMLEERSMTTTARQNAMQDELNLLHETIERLSSEKRELEALAAEQAQTCEQLTEANNTLSARALSLAADAAQSSDMVRKQYEAQLAELKKALDLAQDELDSMRMSEQTQRIALLDELNTMQTENGSLRAQLRAAKK